MAASEVGWEKRLRRQHGSGDSGGEGTDVPRQRKRAVSTRECRGRRSELQRKAAWDAGFRGANAEADDHSRGNPEVSAIEVKVSRARCAAFVLYENRVN